MPTLFPEDYEKGSLTKKKKLARDLKLKNELSALDISFNAHCILDYLKQQGVERPNRSFVKAFQYAAAALGVPYEVIDEAFFTRTPLTEQTLFDVSHLFNPNVKISAETDLPIVPITIDFYSICLSLFEKLPFSFWQQYLKKDTVLPETKLAAYDLEALLQAFVQEVWLKTKGNIKQSEESEVEKARQMFLAYFYRNDQKYYRKETQEMLLDLLEKRLEEQATEVFTVDKTLQSLLEAGDAKAISSFVLDRLFDWTHDKNYQRFLRSVIKTKNLSLMNQLLLLYQRAEAIETKEVNDWIRENRTLKEDAEPVFLLGGEQFKVDPETGEILKEKNTVLDNKQQLPVVPYFEKSETEGREEIEKKEVTPKRIFEILEHTVPESIVFEERVKSVADDHSIRIRSNQSEEQTISDLIICILEKEKQPIDDLIRFENESIASIVMAVFGLNPLPLNLSVLNNLRSLKNGKVKLQQLFTELIVRSDRFIRKFAEHMHEKEPDHVRPTFEEEIKRAKELERLAMANVSTDKANKAEQKEGSTVNISDLLEKVKESSEGTDDDRDD
ncbi:hypothetical protein Q1X24_15520 [Enterococcus sp. B1E4]|uniref:hypothetical protein n=1 Tax=Enterococcus sp. B1E4 TaxID=3061044 RepID=UPI00265BEE5C|nr:hypothetical protein [Enterococcus sp. B1E4]MDO0896266.1 hypothetical protein [Enterococcus sp. B1E4]